MDKILFSKSVNYFSGHMKDAQFQMSHEPLSLKSASAITAH